MKNDTDETNSYAGIDTDCINSITTTQERCDWCWAASIQIMLKYDGLIIAQKDIVSRIFELEPFDNGLDMRVTNEEITECLQKLEMKDEANKTSYTIQTKVHSKSNSKNIILTELRKKRPVMLSFTTKDDNNEVADVISAHIVVITGINYSIQKDKINIKTFMVLDPAKNENFGRYEYVGEKSADLIESINAFWLIDVKNNYR